MRVFKNKWFTKFARKQKIGDDVLLEAILRADLGLVDAELGGGLIKLRIGRLNEGKSGGFRTLLFFRKSHRGFFVYGFAKNERENISNEELAALKMAAGRILGLSNFELQAECEAGAWIELDHG
jgi:hypothetical protein